VDLTLFAKLVEDRSGTGCYCTDEELRGLLSQLPPRQELAAELTSQSAIRSPEVLRTELVSRVFTACDKDGDFQLNREELRTFAHHTGFQDCDGKAWDQEYRSFCLDVGADPACGVGLEFFRQLIDDQSEKGCYCTDEELRIMLIALEEPHAANTTETRLLQPTDTKDIFKPATVADPPLEQAAQQSFPAPSLQRGVLLRTVFHLCDADGDGFLTSDEMHRFARQKGFDGTQAEWVDEYDALCEEVNVDPAKGIDVLILERLANDASSRGCYCTDAELREMRARLEQEDKARLEAPFLSHGLVKEEASDGVKPASLKGTPATEESANALMRMRTDLIRDVFTACDSDGDGRLTSWEMRQFADWSGFQGDAKAWNDEYRLLCSDHKADPSTGVDLVLFTQIVNDDDSESGCYCTNSELQSMVARWKQQELGPHDITSVGLSAT